MSAQPGLYYADYNQDKILEYLKSKRGNLNDYQRDFHPNYHPNSIYAWMGVQDHEFRMQCRIYRNPAKKISQIEKFHEDYVRSKLIQNQRKWRQRMEEKVVLNLPTGINKECV